MIWGDKVKIVKDNAELVKRMANMEISWLNSNDKGVKLT
jgi:hypothetical protein